MVIEFVLLLLFNYACLLTNGELVVGCYFTNWAQHRVQEAKFLPRNIDSSLCTHAYFAFANIDLDVLSITSFEANDFMADGVDKPNLYEEFNKIKKKNRKVKTLLSLGGASAGIEKFRALTQTDEKTSEKRRKFIKNTIVRLREHKFDGLDIDWEFPEARDKTGFTTLVKDFRIAFQNEAVLTNRPRLLLTAAVAVWRPKVEAGYEPGEITQYLDYINLMAYDYHGSWNKNTGHNSPLFARQGQTGDQLLLNQEASINAWIELGAEPEKLVLGLAMYGRTFTLKTKKMNGMNAPSKNAGESGPFTQAPGFLSYYEICNLMNNDGWTKEWNDEQKIPYAYKDDQWVGFDDPESIRLKCEYAISRKLAGAMIWSLDLDDFTGKFCSEGKYPLLRSIKVTFDKHTPNVTFPSTEATTTVVVPSGSAKVAVSISLLVGLLMSRILEYF